jgi:hypothetical protein
MSNPNLVGRIQPPPVTTRLDSIEPENFGIPHALRDQPGGGIAGLHPAWAGTFNSWYQRLMALPALQDFHSARVGGAFTITGASWAAGVATITAPGHNFVLGQKNVMVSGINPSGYSGTFTITAVAGNTFSYALASNPGPYVSGGVAVAQGYSAQQYPDLLFFETDRGVFYVSMLVSNVWTWVYAIGEGAFTQATLPADLGTSDAGFLAQVTDYGHRLKWIGSGWGWAPGDSGSDYKQDFFDAPAGNGWHLCDGSTVNYLKSDGTLGSKTLPNLAGNPAYIKSGNAYTGTINSAVPPVVPSENTGTPSLTTTVQSGTGATVAASNHTHVVPSENTTMLGGDPVANLVLIPYFRQ